MPTIAETCAARPDAPLIICDVSPPRSASPQALAPAASLAADWISVAYNPGRSARANSAMAARWIQANAGKDAIFTIATRDINRLAAQSLLLGAELLGLRNVVVVKGDDFAARESGGAKPVNDYAPTQLIRAIADMNRGVDFKGLPLAAPANLCVGATLDTARGIERECDLTRRKIDAGAQFFISQPTFAPQTPLRFLDAYAHRHGDAPSAPIFFGVQMVSADSVKAFGETPRGLQADLRRGRSSADIAQQTLDEFFAAGLRRIYLLPPILRGGERDYEAARRVLDGVRASR